MSNSPWKRPLDAPSAEKLHKAEFAGELIDLAAHYNHKGLGVALIIETLISAAAIIATLSTGKSKEDREKTHNLLMKLSRETFDSVLKDVDTAKGPQP